MGVVLHCTGKQGPSWNNLSLEQNSTYYNHSDEHMLAMLSHEIGIHVLLPRLQEQLVRYRREIPEVYKEGVYRDLHGL